MLSVSSGALTHSQCRIVKSARSSNILDGRLHPTELLLMRGCTVCACTYVRSQRC